jgi:predicted Zn-dependent peptidase
MLDRITPPPFNRSLSFDLIKPVRISLPNGLVAQFISGGTQEVVRIELIFNAGRWFESKWGLSHFAANLLTKGTTRKNSFEIAQIFDQYGAHLEVSPSLDLVSVSLYSLTKNIKPTLELFQEIIATPVFPDKELRQSKSIFIQNLKVNNEKTSFLASKLIRKNLFGENHPYGKDLEETDVMALHQHELVAFHAALFTNMQIIVAGKIDDTVQQLIIDTFSKFETGKVNERSYRFEKKPTGETYQEKEGSLQTSIRLGKLSLLRTDAEYADVLFVNHILGGYFGSRLMKNIREEKGLTYGINSSIHALKNESYLVIGADVNKENRMLAVQEIRNELKSLRMDKISDEELDTAKYHFIGSLQSEITTPFAHAEKIKNILIHDLDPRFYQHLIARVDAVTGAELLAIAEKHFSEESFIEVSVG